MSRGTRRSRETYLRPGRVPLLRRRERGGMTQSTRLLKHRTASSVIRSPASSPYLHIRRRVIVPLLPSISSSTNSSLASCVPCSQLQSTGTYEVLQSITLLFTDPAGFVS